FGADAVIPDPDVRELEIAVGVALSRNSDAGSDVFERDGRAGQRRPVRVADRAEHGGRVELRESGVSRGNEQQTQERDQTSEFPPDGDSHITSPLVTVCGQIKTETPE